MKPTDNVLQTLKFALNALTQSSPKQSHYDEANVRHNNAIFP